MGMNGLGACVQLNSDSGTASTLATDIRYMTSTAGGATIDPCGFSIYIGYTGSQATGTAFFYSDNSLKLELFYSILICLFLFIYI